MTKHYVKRFTLLALVAIAVPLGSLAAASPAVAAPKGIFSKLSNCPLATFKALGIPTNRALCQFAETTGGELAIGSTKVPINSGVNAGKTIDLEGGAIPDGNPENEQEYFTIPGANGNSLQKVELNVPGGLLDVVNCEDITGNGLWEKSERGTCKFFFENPATDGVTATTEVVANTSNPALFNGVALAFEEGTALTLPVRIHLKNPLLGASCYVGSESKPIQLHLTTGETQPELPNKPIHGTNGKERVEEEKGQFLARLIESSLVDNTFSVPVAEGCGEFFSFIIDPLIDSKLGLPSEDGHNTAKLNGNQYTASAAAVEASESF